MAVITLYPELLGALRAGPPALARLSPSLLNFLAGLDQTYGGEHFGPTGASGALQQQSAALEAALAPAPAYGLEAVAERLLSSVLPLLPGEPPDLYLSTLLFMAPAATLSIGGCPAIAIGLERFSPAPPTGGPKIWYHPSEIIEMIPHEATHAARMQALGLPPTPRRLSVLEMVMLEGTALTFTDLLVGRETLATFMPEDRLNWHRTNDAAVRAAVAHDFGEVGMAAFRRYFSADSPISGYYVGYSLCREYLRRYGREGMTELIRCPSPEIINRLGWG